MSRTQTQRKPGLVEGSIVEYAFLFGTYVLVSDKSEDVQCIALILTLATDIYRSLDRSSAKSSTGFINGPDCDTPKASRKEPSDHTTP